MARHRTRSLLSIALLAAIPLGSSAAPQNPLDLISALVPPPPPVPDLPGVPGIATLPLALIDLVKVRLAGNSTDTWVAGTQIEALLEMDLPQLSVFSATPFAPNVLAPYPVETNAIIARWAAIRSPTSSEFATVRSGAAGDPASLGVGWILAALSTPDLREEYTTIINEETDYLMERVPRTPDGAISTRPPGEPVQLWADFVAMVPPYLAYMGAASFNKTLIQEAYAQCGLYRSYLRDPSSGLWKHIVLGHWGDAGLWGTGNAWAAWGMSRVLATILHSGFATEFAPQAANLTSWVYEIINSTISHMNSTSHLLPNYYLRDSTFGDSSSSALIASTIYRMATLGLTNMTHVASADLLREAVVSNVNATTGWLAPVVDPFAWSVETDQSPEGEAFVILMEASRRDYLLGLTKAS